MSKAITPPANLIRPVVYLGDLDGPDGNAFVILGTVTNALRAAGNDGSIISGYLSEARSGDYEHLLAVTNAYIEQPPLGFPYDDDE